MTRTLGINFGTTTSMACVMLGGRPEMIVSPTGSEMFPSILSFAEGRPLVGEAARKHAQLHPGAIFGVKRLLGRSNREVRAEFKDALPRAAGGDDSPAGMEFDGAVRKPHLLAALLLRQIKDCAELQVGETISDAVIAAPARFNELQRQALKRAANLAGLHVRRFISEPVAAAIAYARDRVSVPEYFAVVDVGGGTLDAAIVGYGGKVVEVLGCDGDPHTGGMDFDMTLARLLAADFRSKTGKDVSDDKETWTRLLEAAEQAKCDLSGRVSVTVNIPYLSAVDGSRADLTGVLSRDALEKAVEPLFGEFRLACARLLKEGDLTRWGKENLKKILLVGGGAHMPLAGRIVREAFDLGCRPSFEIDPVRAIATGVAMYGSMLSGLFGGAPLIIDATPLSLGVKVLGGVMETVIPRNTSYPCSKTKTFATTKDQQTRVDVAVFQGESKIADDNIDIGTLVLAGIPPASRGAQEIAVTFSVDHNGMIEVAAKVAGFEVDAVLKIGANDGQAKDEAARDAGVFGKWLEAARRYDSDAVAEYQTHSLLAEVDRNLSKHAVLADAGLRDGIAKAAERLRNAMTSKDPEDEAVVRDAVLKLGDAYEPLKKRIALLEALEQAKSTMARAVGMLEKNRERLTGAEQERLDAAQTDLAASMSREDASAVRENTERLEALLNDVKTVLHKRESVPALAGKMVRQLRIQGGKERIRKSAMWRQAESLMAILEGAKSGDPEAIEAGRIVLAEADALSRSLDRQDSAANQVEYMLGSAIRNLDEIATKTANMPRLAAEMERERLTLRKCLEDADLTAPGMEKTAKEAAERVDGIRLRIEKLRRGRKDAEKLIQGAQRLLRRVIRKKRLLPDIIKTLETATEDLARAAEGENGAAIMTAKARLEDEIARHVPPVMRTLMEPTLREKIAGFFPQNR